MIEDEGARRNLQTPFPREGGGFCTEDDEDDEDDEEEEERQTQ